MAAPRRHKRGCDAEQIGYRPPLRLVNRPHDHTVRSTTTRFDPQAQCPDRCPDLTSAAIPLHLSRFRRSEVGVDASCRRDERSDSSEVLPSGRGFDAAGDVDHPGSNPGDPLRNVFGSQAAGQDQAGQGRDARPEPRPRWSRRCRPADRPRTRRSGPHPAARPELPARPR